MIKCNIFCGSKSVKYISTFIPGSICWTGSWYCHWTHTIRYTVLFQISHMRGSHRLSSGYCQRLSLPLLWHIPLRFHTYYSHHCLSTNQTNQRETRKSVHLLLAGFYQFCILELRLLCSRRENNSKIQSRRDSEI